ncbi:transporter [Seohaeicola saemankumensis]|nr:transporter [Seohaeicola saemankumensis]MCA0870467.1 transporter [Seohaeicola saemankumensis]
MNWFRSALLSALVTLPFAGSLRADEASALAQKLSNPISDLISLPFQFNYDQNLGASGQGSRWTVNVQPVVPISLNENWNLISRTIVPLTRQDDVTGAGTSQGGVGDVFQSFFFSPKHPSKGGLIWGVGAAFLLPTATDPALGADTFAAGPTAVALWQKGPWTVGALANHVWDIDGPADISNTFLQPFAAYGFGQGWTVTLQAEATRDWVRKTNSVPVGLLASKVTKLGNQPVSIGGGVRYYVDSAPNGPSGLGARVFLTWMYPK